MKKETITVKFMARNIYQKRDIDCWLRQFPGEEPCWGNCRYVFDKDERQYDWLVVYHDLFREPWKLSQEILSCPKENTLLVTTEPSSITVYGSDYLSQYGHILTSQEPWAVPHAHAIFSQPGLMWFYGLPFDDDQFITFDMMTSKVPDQKTKLISTVCSERKNSVTLHNKRVLFTQKLKDKMPVLDIYGHGVKPMSDKAEALDAYRYHIAIENHVYPHHLTEKLPDAFLGCTLPFYYGCPNASDYFTKDSFIHIDIKNFNKALDIIENTIANNEFEDRLPYIIESRKKVLEQYNLFAVLDREISRMNRQNSRYTSNQVIMNRQTLRIKRPTAGIRSLFQKALIKSKHRFGIIKQ